MSRGSTIRIYRHTNFNVTKADYDKYIAYCENKDNFIEQFFGTTDQTPVYRQYLQIEGYSADQDQKTDGLWIKNNSKNFKKKPDISDMEILIEIGSVDFNSQFTVLIDHFGLGRGRYETSDPDLHIFTDEELNYILPVAKYFASSVYSTVNKKVAKKQKAYIDDLVFASNPFYSDFNSDYGYMLLNGSDTSEDDSYDESARYQLNTLTTVIEFYNLIARDNFYLNDYEMVYSYWY